MSSVPPLREFISKRLTAAAEEIFIEFEKTIVRYEEEIGRQQRLLEICWKPQINLHRIELPLHFVRKDEEVLTDQQLWNQKRASSLDQEEPEPLQEEPEPLPILEHEELCIRQDKEQLVLKLEKITSLVTPTDEERDQDEPKPKNHQCLFSMFPESEIQNQDGRTDQFTCPELPQHPFWEKEVLTDQQLCSHEMTSSFDQEEPEPPLMKEEQQELFISQPEEQFILKQENVTFMVTSLSEETDCCEPEPSKNQPLCLMSPEAENRDQDGCRNDNSESNINEKLKKKRRPKQTRDRRGGVESPKLKWPHKGERLFSCEICKKSFSHNCFLTHHMITHTGEKPYSCETCGKCFSLSIHLNLHKRTHTGEKPYSCDTCGKCFSQRCLLIAHKRTHTGEKPYSCDTCGKCFSQRCRLIAHKRTHTGEKPYSCETCGKCFSQRCRLIPHKRTHTGEKPYSCETCGKCFSRKCVLTDHKRTHTGEKPYSCETCGICFSRSTYLNFHKKTHTGEKPYSCETCGKCFSRNTHLNIHKRTHTGEKPYSCETCGKCYSQKYILTDHMRSHTGEKSFPCL